MPWSSDETRIRHLEGAGVPRNSLVPEGSVFIRMFNKDEFQSHLTCSIFPMMSNNCCERMRWGINTSNGSLSAYWLIRIPWRCGHTSALLFSCCCCSANYYSLVLSCLRNLFQAKDLPSLPNPAEINSNPYQILEASLRFFAKSCRNQLESLSNL